MSYPVYEVYAGDVLPVMFSTYAGSTGASVTMTGLAVTDIEIYKDGGTTQRASDAGYTLLDTDGIDFDGVTGIHGFSIDTGDNTDAGFYTTGAWFHVVVSSVTVDSQTVNFIACAFRIVPAESSAGVPKVDVSHFNGTAGTFASGRPEVNATHFAGTAYATAQTAETASIFAYVTENSKTFLQQLRLMYATLVGKASGLGTTTVVFRDDADSKDRVSATVDSSGNRTAFGTKDGT